MAADLRAIVAAVKINTDLERVGDLAINIAEAARRYLQHPPVKKLIDIPRMAEIAQNMLRDALDAFVRRDIDLAQHVLNEDDALDALKTQVFRELLTYMLQDPATIEPALDLILVSRHLERIGDHATNVAEDVIFMVSARDVRHQRPGKPSKAGTPWQPDSDRFVDTNRTDCARARGGSVRAMPLCVYCRQPARGAGLAAVLQRALQAADLARWADGRLPGRRPDR